MASSLPIPEEAPMTIAFFIFSISLLIPSLTEQYNRNLDLFHAVLAGVDLS